jgi:DNA-3-methyladenine glycosylase I
MSGIGYAPTQPTTLTGADGVVRCGWVTGTDTDLAEYHDREWGVPVHGATQLFEALVLTYFENGLSWRLIHTKRDALRRAFAGFEPATVAAMTQRDVERLLDDRTIVRHRAKIEATVHNARLVTELPFGDFVWGFAPRQRRPLRRWSDGRSESPESRRLATGLREKGFRFVGPIVAHSFMQAVGVDNGHFDGCFRAPGSASQ